jgi:hypothetical protein
MPNTFKSYLSNAAGALITTPALTTNTIIGMSVANTSGTTNVSVLITRALTDYYLIKSAPVTAGQSLVVVGGDQKVVLEAGDILAVEVAGGGAISAIASVLEQT